VDSTLLYIGLMSGTSADGIDLALADFSQKKPKLIASYYRDYTSTIREKITCLYNPASNEIDRAFSLDVELAHLFADAIKSLLKQENLSSDDITAIGSHGQTIRHRPNITHPFTLQIGCCQTLATLTNIKVIGQFRRKDMALGGQGAPLVPAFHKAFFQEQQDVVLVNIGGIANVTYLPSLSTLVNEQRPILGFDTGPGNALMDDWFIHNFPSHVDNYDKNGDWAATGTVNDKLLTQLLTDDYFQLLAPKSTGREFFNMQWLEKHVKDFSSASGSDVQATLTKLTALSISNEIKQLAPKAKILLCGGGVHNKKLKNLLIQELTNYEILLTNQSDIDCDIVEAMAFAWLAFAYDKMLLSSIPEVTGASKSCTLGTAFYP